MNRYALLFALFLLSLITYVDRAAISSVKDQLSGEIGLTEQQIGMIFGAFALGYAMAQVPAGMLADRLGPGALLTGVVLAWSALTAATGLASGFVSLLVIRFVFGMAEAGAFPGAARAIYEGLPVSQRGVGHGIVFAGSRLGAACAFPLMAALLGAFDWRMVFYLLAVPGVLWAAGWLKAYRPAAVSVEAKVSRPGPAVSLTSTPVLLAMAQYFIVNFTTFLCLSWMQPYLKQRYGLSQEQAGYYAMIPLVLGTLAQWGTGALVDRLYQREEWRGWSRRMPAMAGFVISAGAMAMIPLATEIGTGVLWFSVAAFGAEMVIAPSWSYCLDLGGSKSAMVGGAMNMMGNVGSFVCANLFPLMGGNTGAGAYFWMVAMLDLMAVLCWMRMKTEVRRAAA